MTTTNVTAEGAPSFWKKWWNALVRCFKRDTACACSGESQSTAKVEGPKVQEKEATG
jgi:hypothetical protein